MTTNYTQHFIVAGTAPFPFDMLRVERAYPTTQEQTNNILFWFWWTALSDPLERQHIHLTRQIQSKSEHPHYDMWLDYGWKVLREWVEDGQL